MIFQSQEPFEALWADKRRRVHWIRETVLSNRFAVFGALVLGVLIPELIHPFLQHEYGWARILNPTEPSLYGAAAALIFSQFGLRRVILTPFVDAKVVILPIVAMSFAVVLVALNVLFLRLSPYHMSTGFLAGWVWYTLLAMLRGRYGRPAVAVIGVDNFDCELLTTRVEWIMWRGTCLPRRVDAIVYDSSRDYSPQWERIFARAVLRNIPVYDFDDFREMLIGRVRLRSRPELVFGQLHPSQPYLRLKRLIDFMVAVALLLPALLILGVAALLVRLDSRGPVIFRQTRVGYRGKSFTCYKLRSMRSAQQGPLYTTGADPRITRVGHYLRKWRVDELPQIFNVLRGDMSWIGPRPEALRLSRAYEREIPYYRYRHSVRPGISGWAAVHQGNVALTEAATRKLEYDFYYLKYFSVWLDFVIVLMTLRTIVTGFGSR